MLIAYSTFRYVSWQIVYVGTDGVEPSTSVLSGQRSTAELRAQYVCNSNQKQALRKEGLFS